jgi:Flp pilus assembly protein TadG
MNIFKSQKGQAIILLAFAIVGIVGFGALAIDGGRVLSDRRHAQNAADTAALAAALAKIKGENYTVAAENRATSNGYTTGVRSAIVQVNLCSETGITCQGVPGGAVLSDYIRVKITSFVPTTFARVLGRDQVKNEVEAVVHAQGVSSSPFSGGAALVAMRPTGTGVGGNGNIHLTVNGSGVFSNSSSNCSMDFVGNGTYIAGGSFTIAGGGTECQTGNITQNPSTPVSGAQLPYPPTNLDIPAPTVNCSGTGSVDTSNKIIHPGNFSGAVSINGNGDYTFESGNYCFNNGVTVNGNVNLIVNNANFRINGGGFDLMGNSKVTCSNLLVYGAGGSGMSFNGDASNTCTGVTFYMASGSVVWNGNVANTFTAPTSGTYKGLLIYLPYGNTSTLTINGNSGNQLTGSIIGPSSPVTIAGNSGTSGLRSQIIGYDVTLSGNSNTTINYDPADQFNPPASPQIEVTK